jgi:hypothetical protein
MLSSPAVRCTRRTPRTRPVRPGPAPPRPAGVVSLIKDLNGNHVVQRCLQRLGPEDSQFIYDAAAAHCMEVATHRHGCCVLQRCIDFATPPQKVALVAEISRNALQLSQDAFGNYVVQYVLELGHVEACQVGVCARGPGAGPPGGRGCAVRG